MSYDIRFVVKVEGIDEYVDAIGCDANITWNVRELIERSSGWSIKNEEHNGLVKDLIPLLRNGLTELEINPSKYTQYESPNGWGTIRGVKEFYRNIISTWEELLNENEALAKVTLIYVC